jgi:tetratricopeptide (TPR) repeat protein
MSLLQLRKYEEAKKVFVEITKSNKNSYNKRSYFYTAITHFERKEWKEAIFYLERYLKVETRQDYIVEAKYLMANSYESIENLKSAYNIYYSILGEYPNTQVIQNRLKAIYDRRVARKR